MNLFQVLSIAVIGVVLILDALRVARQYGSWFAFGLRSLIWMVACICIANPDALTYLARSLGIGRGADVLLYLLTLAFIAMSFLLYAKIVQLRRQMTQLVRHLALTQPLPPTVPSSHSQT